MDFFGPGAIWGEDALSMSDMFNADGTSISANGFNWAFEGKMELLAPEYNRSGIVKHFQIPVGSLIDSAG